MKRPLTILFFLVLAIGASAIDDDSPIITDPVNPNATDEARCNRNTDTYAQGKGMYSSSGREVFRQSKGVRSY